MSRVRGERANPGRVGLCDQPEKETDEVGEDTQEADKEVKIVEEESRKSEVDAVCCIILE